MNSYDFIVVGGGSAGCIVAAELSEDPGTEVLLLECGDHADDHPEVFDADGYPAAFANDRLMWDRFTVNQAACGKRAIYAGTGRGLGGSGSVNGMVYTRGSREDYDEWNVPGWGWDDVVPDFERVEAVIRPQPRPPTVFSEACIAAAETDGFSRKDDLNDGDLRGTFGYETMNYDGDRRRSSFVAYLAPVLDRPNLHVHTGARVDRIVFEARRAVGVTWIEGGEARSARVTAEVILCAGSLHSPAILLRSGVGPADHLAELGIDVVADRPVGGNLHDHANVPVFYHSKQAIDLYYPQLYGFHAASGEGPADTCYVFWAARSSLREAMIRLLPSTVLPLPLAKDGPVKEAVRCGVRGAFTSEAVRRQVDKVFALVVILGKPKSRGQLRLASADVHVPARIDPGYLSDPADMAALVAGVRRARRIVDAQPLDAWTGRELMPGRGKSTDAAIEKWIRKNLITTYHFAGTCRLGADPESVVDPSLKVRGIDGVRVADASVIPSTPISALNAPSMMIGTRAARLVRAAWRMENAA